VTVGKGWLPVAESLKVSRGQQFRIADANATPLAALADDAGYVGRAGRYGAEALPAPSAATVSGGSPGRAVRRIATADLLAVVAERRPVR
jgi:hypothetical protein